jgi:hypothetical protein
MICNIHQNNIAFLETIKTKIRDCNISQFGDDVCKYIIHIEDNLHLITATDASREHIDLLTHILIQLSASPIKPFKESMQQLHVGYLEAKLLNLIRLNLLKQADDKAQVLKYADQWNGTETLAVMALQQVLEQQKNYSAKLMPHIAAHESKLTNEWSYKPQQHHTNDTHFPPNLQQKTLQ